MQVVAAGIADADVNALDVGFRLLEPVYEINPYSTCGAMQSAFILE